MAVEDIALELASIFSGDGDISAIIESFFEGGVDLCVGCEGWDVAFELFMRRAGRDFERFRIQMLSDCRVRDFMGGSTHALVSSSSAADLCRFSSATNPCTGLADSFNRASAPGSSYLLKRVAFTVATNPPSELNVSFTALGSYPQWTMQFAHFALPLSVPYSSNAVVSINSL